MTRPYREGGRARGVLSQGFSKKRFRKFRCEMVGNKTAFKINPVLGQSAGVTIKSINADHAEAQALLLLNPNQKIRDVQKRAV